MVKIWAIVTFATIYYKQTDKHNFLLRFCTLFFFNLKSFHDDPTGTTKFEQVTPYVQQNKENDSTEAMEIAIVKQFTFSSALLRMSVLCKTLGTNFLEVFVKGAPEKIITLCKPESSKIEKFKTKKNSNYFKLVPSDFDNLLHKYTVSGYRVIALAGKQLDPSVSWFQALKQQRDTIESDLTFYGLLIMQNMIKPATPIVINELTNANITSVMVTGIFKFRYFFLNFLRHFFFFS
jgi:cation-transporting ATPase 13A2